MLQNPVKFVCVRMLINPTTPVLVNTLCFKCSLQIRIYISTLLILVYYVISLSEVVFAAWG